MPDKTCKILLVEPDPQALEMLVAAFIERFEANITCVSTAEDALDIELIEPHDLVVVEFELPTIDGIELCAQLAALRTRPTILLADEPTSAEAIDAMRSGVADMFPKPFRVSDLLDSAERALCGFEVHRRHQVRYRRLRELVRRVIRERRELGRRTELICRDLVGAHRKLVQRVMEFEEIKAQRGLTRNP